MSLLIVSIFSLGLLMSLIVVLTFGKGYSPHCKLEYNNVSHESHYIHAAVSSDAAPCVDIANSIMMIKGGNAVDAAIAGIICSCAVNFHSCGIGGGSFVVIYIRKEQMIYTIDLREEAPSSSYETMFVNDSKSALHGGKAIAVMGVVSGYYEMHQKLGLIQWDLLFQPTIDLLNAGFYISKSLENSIKYFSKSGNKTRFKELWNIISDNSTGKPKKFGDIIKIPKLSNTLKIIAKEPYAMRNGSLVDLIIKEIQESGGNITKEDLAEYKVKWRKPVFFKLKDNAILYTLPPPSSGALVGFILNVMSQYSFEHNLDSCDKAGLFLHRFIEAMKFAFAKRTFLGDKDFVKITDIMLNLTSNKYAKWIKSKIMDDRTHDILYYDPSIEITNSFGTSHFSLISPTGDAVSETSTINYLFGSFVMGSETGILYNNEMDDFSIPNKPNIYHLQPSHSNFIKPKKRPMSSMSPLIIVNKYGDVSLVTGASGGSMIISSTALVSILSTIFNYGIKESIDYHRVHHQLLPNKVSVEKNLPIGIINELEKRGHIITVKNYSGIVQGIKRHNKDLSYFECNADYRKMGRCNGY